MRENGLFTCDGNEMCFHKICLHCGRMIRNSSQTREDHLGTISGKIRAAICYECVKKGLEPVEPPAKSQDELRREQERRQHLRDQHNAKRRQIYAERRAKGLTQYEVKESARDLERLKEIYPQGYRSTLERRKRIARRKRRQEIAKKLQKQK